MWILKKTLSSVGFVARFKSDFFIFTATYLVVSELLSFGFLDSRSVK